LHRAVGGLGIGLSLVRRIAELHGGSVRVYSEGSGKGSAFSVYLPLAPAATTGDVCCQPGLRPMQLVRNTPA
jgi:signal transduction histidine kinase